MCWRRRSRRLWLTRRRERGEEGSAKATIRKKTTD
jgi:hypothetical protein